MVAAAATGARQPVLTAAASEAVLVLRGLGRALLLVLQWIRTVGEAGWWSQAAPVPASLCVSTAAAEKRPPAELAILTVF
jgi:hypothetical protein